MKIIRTAIPDIFIISPRVFEDSRGFFMESFNMKVIQKLTGLDIEFVQENHSHSRKGVLRGLHYQIKHSQGKLIRVLYGSVFDVAVDLRKKSNTFGQWIGIELNATEKNQIWIPPGFAHGFMVTSESADLIYKVTDYYFPQYEHCISYLDQKINIKWPKIGTKICLSDRDRRGKSISESTIFE